MNHKFCKNLALSTLFVLSALCLRPQASFAKDPAIGRAKVIENLAKNPQDFAEQSMRFKIITSRTLLLYIQDILPTKGNAYFHMADNADKVTLSFFKKAQEHDKTPALSAIMNSQQWLPKNESDDHNDVIRYWAAYVSVIDRLNDQILPKLKRSPFVGSVVSTTDSQTAEKFNNAFKVIRYIARNYSEKIPKKTLEVAQKRMLLLMANEIGRAMKPHLPSQSQEEIQFFFDLLESISKDSVNQRGIIHIKTKFELVHLFDGRKTTRKKIKRILTNIDLPEEGSIDGADDAYEKVTRLDIGHDILVDMIETIEKW